MCKLCSEDGQHLNKLCDALVNMDISIEDILNEKCDLVDSTTGSLPDTTSIMTGTPPSAKKTKIVSTCSSESIDIATIGSYMSALQF